MSSITQITDEAGVARQYRDSSRLARRANIHKYGVSGIGWFDWIAQALALPAGAAVLDVGCGPGWLWTAASFPAGLDVTLVDISPGMVEEALARLNALQRYGVVSGKVADVRTLPFPDASFDAVFAFHMLYHVPDPARAFDEMVRVLKPGGVLAVTSNGRDNMVEMYAAGHAALGGPPIDPGAVGFGLEAAEEQMKPRLVGVETLIFEDIMLVTDGEDIIAALTSFPPGDAATQSQLDELSRLISSRMANDGGVFRMNKRIGLVTGKRLAGTPASGSAGGSAPSQARG